MRTCGGPYPDGAMWAELMAIGGDGPMSYIYCGD